MKKRTIIISIILGVLLLLISPILLFIGLFSDRYTSPYHDDFKTVKAKVVDYEYEELHNLPTPVFEYTYKGKTYVSYIDSYASAAKENFPLGSEHKIKINPNNPEEFHHKDSISTILGEYYIAFLFASMITTILGVVAIAMSVMKIIKNKKEK